MLSSVRLPPVSDLTLKESAYTMDMWPHPFEAKYTISLGADKLSTELCITNTGSSPFDFTAALHSYWSASGMANIKITSDDFNGATYLNKMLDPPAQVKSADASITISQEVDSVYEGVSGDVLLEDSARSRPLTISNTLGWSDTVIWNPFGSEAMGFDSFVCVESAQASSPVLLQPQEYWVGCMDVVP